MYSFLILFTFIIALLFNKFIGVDRANIELTAISDSHHVVEFYKQLGNKDPPSPQDPAVKNAKIRKRICETLTRSRFFYWKLLDPINLKEIHDELKQPMYSEIFNQIYSDTKSMNFFERLLNPDGYTNAYTLREFEIKSDKSEEIINIREYVFVCLLRRGISERITPIYVSKEYNVAGEPYMGGRFLFGVRGFQRHFMQLAERPAKVTFNQNNGVEFHYLQIKEQQQSQQSLSTMQDNDPICEIVTQNLWNNQYHRLCVQVLTSSDFKGKIEYPRTFKSFECFNNEISFKTNAALKKTVGKPAYREFMIRCNSTIEDTLEEVSFYVSRAYKPNQVFVYSSDSFGKIWLQNLSTNLGMTIESK